MSKPDILHLLGGSACTPFINTTHFHRNFLSWHTVIFKLQEEILHEYFEKSSALNFPSPPILDFCVFSHTKRQHAITFWGVKILKSLSPLDNFLHGLWVFITSHKIGKKYFKIISLYQLHESHFKFLLVLFEYLYYSVSVNIAKYFCLWYFPEVQLLFYVMLFQFKKKV